MTSNPFSPMKNRNNKFQDPASSSQRASNQSRSNPFATPSKRKKKPHAQRRSPSPDPFPPIEPLILVHHHPLSPAVDSPVTRARKRLRGEQVSPSPVKEKRVRVTSQAALSFAGHAASYAGPNDSDGDDLSAGLNDTIMGETPMKPRTGRKNFQALFDDTLMNGDKRPIKALPSSQRKVASSAPGSGLKREKSRALSPPSDDEDDWSAMPKLKSLEACGLMSPKPGRLGTRTVNGKRGIPRSLVPTKDNLHSAVGPSTSSNSNVSSIPPSPSGSSDLLRATNKRSFPDDLNDTNDVNATASNTLLNLPLIPPSPPPPDASKSTGPKYAEKGKGKSVPYGRKKTKLLPGAEGASDEELGSVQDDEIQVREIDPLARLPQVDHVGSDWETDWRTQDVPNDPAPSMSFVVPGKFEVNLPDELQRVLAISPGSRRRETEEEKVVRGLLYGSRETHYDARKGGEIWDVGEESEHGEGTEEDWEAEPVPWEVGEL